MAFKSKFICTQCGFESSSWYGKCPECSSWNTLQEIAISPEKPGSRLSKTTQPPKALFEIESIATKRISTGFEEFDRCLGGGMVPGEVILIAGDPGIGKSTLLLQVALKVASPNGLSGLDKNNKQDVNRVLYVSGEESEDQIKLRSTRLSQNTKDAMKNVFIMSSTNVADILSVLKNVNHKLIIVDSIQTMEDPNVPSFPGSIPQIRHITRLLVDTAKQNKIPLILIGHVTKEGIVAGPMLLSHMVDAVLYIEGEKSTGTRIIRSFKNRFGDISEVGIFVMEEKGLIEIKDVANFFMDSKDSSKPGSCASVIMEGSRAILIEVQALVVPSTLSYPRRVVNGLSERRVELLIAVIQKHVKIPLERLDVFVNVVGGLKVVETAVDLAVCMAIISSYKNTHLGRLAAISEVGLLGELRSVVSVDKRVKEAKKFGFKRAITSQDFSYLTDIVSKVIYKNP